jgi:hypothetical protein
MAAALRVREATAAARSQLADTGAVLSLFAAGATVIEAHTLQEPTAATGPVDTATAQVRRQWARQRSAPLRWAEPTIAAAVAAMTLTAVGFARTGTTHTEGASRQTIESRPAIARACQILDQV